MIWSVWAPLVVPWLGVLVCRRLVEILPPRAAALLLSVTSVLLAALSVGSLTLLTLAGLIRLPVIAAMGHMSALFARQAVPVHLLVGELAALVLGIVALAAGLAARQHLSELRRARDTVRRYGGAGDLTILPDDTADAFALPGRPGRPGRIVVTAGMLRELDARERAALLAHERAHLTGRHHLLVVCADLAGCLHPALRALRGPLSFHLERWADEDAARAVGDRRLTARAIGRAALATSAAPSGLRPAAVPAAAAGPVPRRVAALLAPPRPRARTTAAVAVALAGCVLVSGVGVLDAAQDLHANIEWAQGETMRDLLSPHGAASGHARPAGHGYDHDRERRRDSAGHSGGTRPTGVPRPRPSTLT